MSMAESFREAQGVGIVEPTPASSKEAQTRCNHYPYNRFYKPPNDTRARSLICWFATLQGYETDTMGELPVASAKRSRPCDRDLDYDDALWTAKFICKWGGLDPC